MSQNVILHDFTTTVTCDRGYPCVLRAGGPTIYDQGSSVSGLSVFVHVSPIQKEFQLVSALFILSYNSYKISQKFYNKLHNYVTKGHLNQVEVCGRINEQ